MSRYYPDRVEYSLAKIIDIIKEFTDQPESSGLAQRLAIIGAERELAGLPETVLVTKSFKALLELKINYWILALGLEQQVSHARQAELGKEKKHNPALVATLKRTSRYNPIAEAAFRYIEENNMPVWFVAGLPKTRGCQEGKEYYIYGEYSYNEGIFLDETLPEQRVTQILVHEVFHARQYQKSPDFFTGRLRSKDVTGKQKPVSKVDDYIRIKLIEFEAWNTDTAYTAWENEFRSSIMLRNLFGKTYKELAGTVSIPKKGDVSYCLAPEFAKEKMAKLKLAQYEEPLVPELRKLIRAGTFEDMLRASPFLEKSFLKRFLARPDGKKYPKNVLDDLCDSLIQFVITPHHPKLIKAMAMAKSAKAGRPQSKRNGVAAQEPAGPV